MSILVKTERQVPVVTVPWGWTLWVPESMCTDKELGLTDEPEGDAEEYNSEIDFAPEDEYPDIEYWHEPPLWQ